MGGGEYQTAPVIAKPNQIKPSPSTSHHITSQHNMANYSTNPYNFNSTRACWEGFAFCPNPHLDKRHISYYRMPSNSVHTYCAQAGNHNQRNTRCRQRRGTQRTTYELAATRTTTYCTRALHDSIQITINNHQKKQTNNSYITRKEGVRTILYCTVQ